MTTLTYVRNFEAAEPAARFRDLLASEWLKLWSLRSLRWATGLGALIVVAINANAAFADYSNWPHYSQQIKDNFVPAWSYESSFTDISALVMMLFTGAIGTVAVVGEYGSGMVRTSFAAVPARRSLLAAKAAVLTALMLVFGILVTAGSFWVSQAILSGRGVGISVTEPGIMRGMLASAVLAPACALVGMSLGVLIRHSATATGSVIALLLLVPLFFTEDRYWSAVFKHAMLHDAWRYLHKIPAIDGAFKAQLPYPSTPGGAWLVLALWPVVAVVVALVVVDRRDL
ncbi:ABC transporter permease [Streptomyces beijiangensis]|uniref:ABC transporter permease n=1 Tax=Streptomyces beijiangensis TaxID=163361 RepID=A0A939JFM3_9ACTN|nr:ABC transporter permease [Streptomyces beijiangensis]MBO0512538.1 ABC transporter permease [Streptomyces beijiangensis]